MDNPRRRSTTATVSKGAIAKAATALQALPEKPRENVPLREAMVVMEAAIRSALDKGYSLEEVSAMLTDKGVEVNSASLKYYMSPSRRGKMAEPPTKKRGGKTRTEAPTEVTPAPVKDAVEKAPAKEQHKAEDVIAYLLDEDTPNGATSKTATEAASPKKRGGRRSGTTSTATAAKTKPAARTQAAAAEPDSQPDASPTRRSSRTSTTSTRGRRKGTT